MKRCLKLLLIPVIITLLLSHNSIAQNPSFTWIKNADATAPGFAYGKSLGSDAWGNIYVMGGSSTGEITFGSGDTTTGSFLVKYNIQGNTLWAKKIGFAAFSHFTDLEGNPYITGIFSDTITLGNTTLYCLGRHDMVAAKFDSSGNVVWAQRGGGRGRLPGFPITPGDPEDVSNDIIADAVGNCYVGSSVLASDTAAATFDTISVYTSNVTPRYVTVLSKYGIGGQILWVRTINGLGSGGLLSMATNLQGDVLISGTFYNTISLGGTTLTTNGGNDVFYAAYNSVGDLLWAKSFGGGSPDFGHSIVSNALGEILLAGTFKDTVQIGGFILISSGGNNPAMFLIKTDIAGNVIWASQTTENSSIENPKIVTDNNGNIYCSASFSGNLTVGSQNITAIQKIL